MKALCVLSAAALVLVGGCGKSSTPPEKTSDSAGGPQSVSDSDSSVNRYEGVRGRITAVPVEGSPTEQDLRIHHENMPDFKGKSGKLGMNSMVMPFPIGEGVSLEGFSVGDAVEFDFEVNWDGSPPYWVTSLRKLPLDTVLEFEKSKDTDDHAGHDHAGHDHAGHDHAGHDHGDGGH